MQFKINLPGCDWQQLQSQDIPEVWALEILLRTSQEVTTQFSGYSVTYRKDQ